MKLLNLLLVFVPVSIACRFLHVDGSLTFLFTCLAIVPLSALIGDATEQVALYSGPKIGGLLNATMGNVPELLIGIFAVKAGLYSLVLASLAGSIMGNVMLVLGFSVLLGGLKYKFQNFNMMIARSNLTLLAFAAVGMILPFVFKYSLIESGKPVEHPIQMFSIFIAILMVCIYLSGLVFSLITHRNLFTEHDPHNDEGEEEEKPSMTLMNALLLLAGATVFVAIESEILVATVEAAIAKFHLSEAFVGIIIIPILGNVAEHASAMMMAVKNKIDISIEIAVGSSMQIALFVAPILVILSFILGNPISYVYSAFEITAIVSGIALAIYVFIDGKTNWMEGLLLIGSYITLGVAFFFI
jgi:Ca2+:H+ antiporter